MMIRFLSFMTLVLVAVCVVVGASIALADGPPAPVVTPAQGRPVEAVDPDRRMIDDPLAAFQERSSLGSAKLPATSEI